MHFLPLPKYILSLCGHVLGTYFRGSSDLGFGKEQGHIQETVDITLSLLEPSPSRGENIHIENGIKPMQASHSQKRRTEFRIRCV